MRRNLKAVEGEIAAILEQAFATTISRVKAAQAQGKRLSNGTSARLLFPLTPVDKPRNTKAPSQVIGVIELHDGGFRIVDHRIYLATTRYFVSWGQWDSVEACRQVLREAGVSEQDGRELLYRLADFTYGAMGHVYRRVDGRREFALGIRSQVLAARNVGMAAPPAGGASPFEFPFDVLRREVKEETGFGQIDWRDGFAVSEAFDPPAFSLTLAALGETKEGTFKETFEMKGGKFVWVPEEQVHAALGGDSTELVQTFRSKFPGIDVPDTLKLAGDCVETFRILTQADPT